MNSIKYRDVLYEHREVSDLKELVNSSADLFGDRDAFLVKDSPGSAYRPISYRRMRSDIDSLGTALTECGLFGAKVALIGENRYEWVISYLAVTNGVGVIVPFDRELCAEELADFMRRAGVRAIIYSSKLERLTMEADKLFRLDCLISMDALEHDGRRLSLPALLARGRQLIAAGLRVYLDAAVDANALCAILFTSGTTGMPKGVMLSHKNIAANVCNMSKYVDVSGGCTGLSVLPMHHTYEMTCHIMTAVYQGCRIAICEGLKYIVKNMAESKASVMLGVPLIFENMHRKVWKNAENKGKARKMRRAIALSKLVNGQNTRIVNRLFKEVHQALGGNVLLFISGGAPIDPLVVEDFNAMGLPMIQGYGMTENAPIIAVNKDKYNKPASVGLPMPGTEVRIINEDGSGIGEIICRGDSVMLGYYDDPEETARVLADGWLHTEDFGYFDSDGFLYVTGRKKNLIIAKNGKNVSPEELEYFLCKIPYIAEVMVWGADDERGGDVVICADIFPDFAYAAEACGKPPGRDELKRILKKEIDGINEKLPGYKRIRRFALRDSEFEKTTVQKIKRHTVVHGSREPAKEPGGYMNKGGMYRMAVQDDYAAVKAREKAEADALIAEIQKNTDPRVRYKDVRAVTDMRHMLEESVALYADRTAFHVKDVPAGPYRQISYRQMKQDVDALGTALAAQGLRRVAVIGENCYQWAISYLAVACGGGVIVPLDKELNASELKQLLIASEAECVLFTKKFRKIFTDIHASGDTKLRRLIDLTGEEASVDVLLLADCMEEGRRLSAEGNRAYADARISGDEMCSLIFTSGTTGVAKGVMLSHKNLAAGLMIPPTVIRIAKEDIFFSVLPIHHSYECTCGFLIPLYRGASIAYCEGLKYIVKNLAEARPTVLLAVPLILESLYKKIWQNVKASGKEKLLRRVIKINAVTKKLGIDLAPTFFKQILELFGGRMKLVICGGAAIDPAILQGLRDFGICAFQGYGLTECSPICAVNPDSAIKNSAAGYLAPGFDAKIIGADAETGIGEICVKGPHVMLGYYGNKEATDEVLKDGWFCTGDLGYVDDERYVHITGRKKNVIITKNGKNVYPEELEYYLGRIDAVSECMVWGMDSEQSGETLIVAGIRPDEDALRAELGERYTEEQVEKLLWSKVDSLNAELALFKRIRRIIVRKREFEMTTGKKIKRFVEENKGV